MNHSLRIPNSLKPSLFLRRSSPLTSLLSLIPQSPVLRIPTTSLYPSCLTVFTQSSTVRGYASNASSQRWVTRQIGDPFTKAAKLEQMKGRAGFKLMHLNYIHKFLGPGMTVVDLGYAPGAWTEVAVKLTNPGGRVIGVDILPATPPTGASTFQGDFLDEKVQMSLRRFLDSHPRGEQHFIGSHGYLEAEREESVAGEAGLGTAAQIDSNVGKETVDVVLSDMWEPWVMLSGHWVNSIKIPYHRLMNVSGLRFKDHSDSMDLCVSALLFAVDVLKPKGSFICKFYSGAYDKQLEAGIKAAFGYVKQEKPESSRKESRELYFVAKEFKEGVTKEAVLARMPKLV